MNFFEAIEKGDLEQIKKCGANSLGSGNIPILTASRLGYLEILKYLVSIGADVRSGNDFAFILAASNGHLEVVKYLVSLGADIHRHDNYAIISASSNGHLEVVKYLASLKADVSKITKKARKYIDFCKKMAEKRRHRAAKKIYFWWIPICYDITRECGQRMKLKNLETAKELGVEFKE
jgi:hypothetical protein